MTTKVHTGGGKDFVYTGKEEYGDTEPTRQFKEHYHKWKSQSKWKRKLFRYKPPKENIHRKPIQSTIRQEKKSSLIVAIILTLIIIGLSIKLSDGTLTNLDEKLSKIRGILSSDTSKKESIEEGIVLPGNIVKEESLIIVDEKTFERKEESKQAFEYSVNELRREKELLEMEWSENTYNLAVFRAKDLYKRDYFEHVTPEGLTVSDYLEEFNIAGYAGENLGGMAHYPNEEVSGNVRQVVRQWMVSVGHKQNLMDRDHDIGAIGCYKYICVFIGVSGGEVEQEEVIEVEEEPEEETVPIPRGYYASRESCGFHRDVAFLMYQSMDQLAQNECLAVCGREDKSYADKYKCDSEGRFLCKCY